MFEQQSCFAPKMFEQNSKKKSIALQPKILSEIVALNPKWLN